VIRSQHAENCTSPGADRVVQVTAPPAVPNAPVATAPGLQTSAPLQLASGIASNSPGAAEQRPASAEDDLHRVHRIVSERAAGLETYIARLRRREIVNGKQQPEELINFEFRRQPFSVHMKWLAPEDTQGREVLYVKGHFEDKLHILVEKSMFAMGGKLLSFELDSPMVKDKSRHSVTDAGIHQFLARFDTVLAAMDHGETRLGSLVYHGPQNRPEFERPAEMVEHIIPPGYEPLLPHGGRRFVFCDPISQLPLLLITHDETGREVEYYCYDRLLCNVRLDDRDFNPASLTPAKK
jgi:hypothetical protein